MSAAPLFTQRTELLLGPEAMDRIASRRVILFGVGGVGSWCAESLVRSGIRQLTVVDPDRVCRSNINRQLVALHSTEGRPKVEVLRERLLDISPQAEITALPVAFCEDTADTFGLEGYDYILDCIDSLRDKVLLIQRACRTKAVFFASMGAALKVNPALVEVQGFWDVTYDPLARMLRKRLRQAGDPPGRNFLCVCSQERMENRETLPEGAGRTNGSLMAVTATFGLTLSALVLRDAAGLLP